MGLAGIDRQPSGLQARSPRLQRHRLPRRRLARRYGIEGRQRVVELTATVIRNSDALDTLLGPAFGITGMPGRRQGLVRRFPATGRLGCRKRRLAADPIRTGREADDGESKRGE